MTIEMDAVRLSSEDLFVDVLPANGGDIFAVIDRATEVDLLWKAPWAPGWRPDEPSTSRDRWLARTWGGWQLLLPNTGDEANEGGSTWGFHGEAGVRSWSVVSAATQRVELEVDLETAPLDVRRVYRLDGSSLFVDTTIQNRSKRSVEFLWGEHPTFSESFAAGARLEIDAQSVQIALAAGMSLEVGDRLPWPPPAGPADGTLDELPSRRQTRLLFAFLDGLKRGTYSVHNDRLGLAARLTWPLDVFPVVWLWEEIGSSQEAPWNGQAFAVGIEPQAAYPALGMTELRRTGGQGITLEPGAALNATVTLSVGHSDGSS
jgi:galactose mutarotase-like enzyme